MRPNGVTNMRTLPDDDVIAGSQYVNARGENKVASHLRVGFIGLGFQGKPLARNIVDAGHALTVYDVRQPPLDELAAAGAKVATSCAEFSSDFFATSVMTGPPTGWGSRRSICCLARCAAFSVR